jgi:hypothetical protein
MTGRHRVQVPVTGSPRPDGYIGWQVSRLAKWGYSLREAFPISDQWQTRAWFTVARAAAAHTKSFVLSHSLFTCPT